MVDVVALQTIINTQLKHLEPVYTIALDELTIEIPTRHIIKFCTALRDESELAFDLLVDVCGVDYLHYGVSEWETDSATGSGFERGVMKEGERINPWNKPRFAVVYHLLSTVHNHRIRIRTFVEEHEPIVDSVIEVWPAANWFEREAFDLYGIMFNGHPDLRRILTDYGFIGHPFRKDFPMSGQVEVRYDAALQRVIYEPVSIEPRVLVPKVVREDNRYLTGDHNV